MSGSSDNTDCPRCKGKGTLETYTDWKPFDTTTGLCLRCGFQYYYKFEIEKADYINERIEEYENKELEEEANRRFTKDEQKNIIEFDELQRKLKKLLTGVGFKEESVKAQTYSIIQICERMQEGLDSGERLAEHKRLKEKLNEIKKEVLK